MDLGPDGLRRSPDDVRRWLGARREDVHTVHFGTFDELLCHAQFHRIVTRDASTDAEAFVRTWRAYLEHVEERPFEPDDLGAFLASLGADDDPFPAITDADWLDRTSITHGIREAIGAVRTGARLVHGERLPPSEVYDLADAKTYWGVYEDGRRVPEDTPYGFLAPGALREGVAIRHRWNDVALFARMPTEYVLFVWSTGA